MIKRIVKMTFHPEKAADFLRIFDNSGSQIRAFPGCLHLELWRCQAPADHIFFTYSFWSGEEALEQYRQSELFQKTWSQTKLLFSDRPEAWSVKVERVPEP